jgi:disulfide bond formation protein DsbB
VVNATDRTALKNTSVGSETVSPWTWAALAVALAGLGGSLSLSILLGLKACPLCFYQRTFVMSVVGVLVVGLCSGAARGARLGLLALPLATAGLGVALFHVFLETKGALECPEGIFGLGTAPQQSLAVFLVLFLLLVADVLKAPARAGQGTGLVVALVLGALLAVGSCTSNPPMPDPPREPYPRPPDVCRPPYRLP